MTQAASMTSETWTIRRVLTWAAEDLKKRGQPTPRLDAEVLLGHVLGLPRVKLVIDSERPLSAEELSRYKALHQRRRSGEPIAYLVGVREFYGRSFRVDRRVLVPRPETEILVETALRRTRALSLSARVLDLCTGSGCVAITLGRERPTTRVVAADISADALAVAEGNALRLGAFNVAFVRSDLFAGLAAIDRSSGARRRGLLQFDLITANPPYIAAAEMPELPIDVRNFEPHLALAGGADGLDVVRRILADAPAFAAEGAIVALEIGAGQAPATEELFRAEGYADIERTRDYAGHERIVSGKVRR